VYLHIGLVDATTPKLQTVWKYARVELRPPSLSELPEVRKGFQDLVKAYRTQKWKQVTVKVWKWCPLLDFCNYFVTLRFIQGCLLQKDGVCHVV